jgi:hypothetical protein
LAQAQLVVAQSNDNAVKNGPDPVQVASAQANINSIQSTLAQQNITAPFDGVISVVTVKPGDLVSNGTAAFQIDDPSVFYVDLQVSEVDINEVILGQTVDLTFDAIPGTAYTGNVADIGSVGTVSGGVSNFIVTVALTKADNAVKPGMTATASIITQQVSNILVVPNRAISTVGTHKVIYILANNRISPETVTVGLASDTQVEVSSPTLKSGDVVVTNPTVLATAIAISSTPSFFTGLFSALGMAKAANSGGVSGSIQVAAGSGFPGGGTFPGGGNGGTFTRSGTPGAGTNGGGTTINGTPGPGTTGGGTTGAGTPGSGTPGGRIRRTPGPGTPAAGTPTAGTPVQTTPGG